MKFRKCTVRTYAALAFFSTTEIGRIGRVVTTIGGVVVRMALSPQFLTLRAGKYTYYINVFLFSFCSTIRAI